MASHEPVLVFHQDHITYIGAAVITRQQTIQNLQKPADPQ